jgi:hypothetical protein
LDEALIASGIVGGECLGPSTLIINAVPSSPRHDAPVNTPFYLLDAPKLWIKDMLYGRLALVSIHNPGRFVFEAAKDNKYDLRFLEAATGPGDYYLAVPKEIHGEPVSISIPGIQQYIQQVVTDLRGVKDFIAYLPALLRASDQIPAFIEAQDSEESGH